MDIICITGTTPGAVFVTVSHEGQVRQLPMDVARHAAGGWQARLCDAAQGGGAWGLRCYSVNTAVLLEAADAFTETPASKAAPLVHPALVAAAA